MASPFAVWDGAEVQESITAIPTKIKVLMDGWSSAEARAAATLPRGPGHHEYSGWGTTSWSKRLADLGRFVQWRPHEQGTGNGR